MTERVEFLCFCFFHAIIEYNVMDYIVSCYGALHTMGGLAIAEDIQSLIKEIEEKNGKKNI